MKKYTYISLFLTEFVHTEDEEREISDLKVKDHVP